MLSLADGQRLMGFPDTHEFEGSATRQRRQIGNSVCPPVAKALGEWAKKAIQTNLGM